LSGWIGRQVAFCEAGTDVTHGPNRLVSFRIFLLSSLAHVGRPMIRGCAVLCCASMWVLTNGAVHAHRCDDVSSQCGGRAPQRREKRVLVTRNTDRQTPGSIASHHTHVRPFLLTPSSARAACLSVDRFRQWPFSKHHEQTDRQSDPSQVGSRRVAGR